MPNSFSANINELASKLNVVEQANDVFNPTLIPVLKELSQLNLKQVTNDLLKGNYLGNRKIDIDLALNVNGITEELIRKDPAEAERLWIEYGQNIPYTKAMITFVDGEVIELPFLSDNNPTNITTTAGLLQQFSRTDVVEARVQEDLIYSFDVLNNTVYTVTINNVDYSYTSGDNATRGEIVTGLTNQINTGDAPFTAYNEIDNIRVKADIAGNDFLLTVDINMLTRTDVTNITAGNYETAFLAKLEDTSYNAFNLSTVNSIVRFYDIIGKNSNIERIQLFTGNSATNFNETAPVYYWAKTTSALDVISMRAGDIIKLGNEIDNIVLLANSITQVLEIQDRIPELIDTYVNGNPQGDVTIYNKLQELIEIYNSLTALITIYNDIKVGGTNNINIVAESVYKSKVETLANPSYKLNIETVSNDITAINTVSADIIKVKKVANDIANVNTVSTNITKVNSVGNNISDVVTVSDNITKVDTVHTNIAKVQTVADNIQAVIASLTHAQNAEASKNKAEQWANEAEDVEVETGKYSSKHYSLKSEANKILAEQAKTQAEASAITATQKSDEIKGITAQANTLIAGQPVTVSYNSASGQFTFGIPQGDKGDRGDAFQVNSVGTLANRDNYDGQPKNFSYLATDVDVNGSIIPHIYFKLSDTSGDWSDGSPFGKGDKGDKGDTGTSIQDIVFNSTTDGSGNAAQQGATDTYRVTLTDGSTHDFNVVNGADSDMFKADNLEGLADYVIARNNLGLGNVDNIADLNKPISNAMQTALNNKVDNNRVLTDVPTDAVFTDTVYDDTSLTNLVNTKLNNTNPVITGSITEQVIACNLALEPDNGTVQTYTATSDFTFTDELTEGQFLTLILSSAGYTATYPTITWWEGAEPILGTIDKLYFEKINGTLYGSHIASIT